MKKQTNALEKLVKEVPPEYQEEVKEFVVSVIKRKKQIKKPKGKPTFKWAGALADLKDKYTSVELQHKISEWMSGYIS